MEEGRRKEGGRGLQNNYYDADRNRKTRTETEIKKIVMIMLLTMVTVDDNVHMNMKMMIVITIKIVITRRRQVTEEDIRVIFNLVDIDKSGAVTKRVNIAIVNSIIITTTIIIILAKNYLSQNVNHIIVCVATTSSG